MEKCTAFVLGGGGSRGALQVGAMRALLEAGITPDLLVGTSIGAVNAAGLALWGVNMNGLNALEDTWRDMAGVQILDPRMTQLFIRAAMGHPSDRSRKKVEEYFIARGFARDLRFAQISGVRLGLISADIENGRPVIYGRDPDGSVLEGLLASIALPPWFTPFHKDGRLLIDGGALSNIPIEPAMRMGASEIIVLDLDDATLLPKDNLTITQYFEKYLYAVSRRHTSLEKKLAEMKGIPIRWIDFQGVTQKPIWDFSDTQVLIEAGYEKARRLIAGWSRMIQADDVLFTPLGEKLPT
jgi:NTE family protein